MPIGIAFIRGINVGGKNLLPMEVLRGLCAEVGLCDARTYIQSGNVVFRAGKRELARAAAGLEGAIGAKRGFRPRVVVRGLDELRAVAAGNPLARPGLDGSKLLVMFLASAAAPAANRELESLKAGRDRVHLAGREVYLYFAKGVAKSTLSMAAVEAALKVPGTCRNWNTVNTLLGMAEDLEASEERA